MPKKDNLIGFIREELQDYLVSLDEKPYRGLQIFEWIHNRGVIDFDSMTNLGKDLIEKLKINSILEVPEVIDVSTSSEGTKKFLLKLDNDSFIEMVKIPEKKRQTLCISSQAGCALQCTFCATGYHGFKRNLTSSEIISQLWLANYYEDNSERISNVVFMGMGEPLMNTENVLKTIQIMQDQKCYSLSKRRITLSTSGIVPEIEAITGKTDVSLAISLHASNDDLRNKIVPINKKYPIKELLSSSKKYLDSLKSKSHITIEYILINDVNDSIEDASNLVNLLSDLKCKINLIPFNPFPESDYERSTNEKVKAFKDYLIEHNFIATVRVTRGDEIDGACGQLVGKLINPIGSKKLKNKQIAAQNLHKFFSLLLRIFLYLTYTTF